jgi:hypothetical protein
MAIDVSRLCGSGDDPLASLRDETSTRQRWEIGSLELVDYENETYYSGSEFIGFWLRRYMDGSERAIYTALDIIMKKFDNYWYTKMYDSDQDLHRLSKTKYVSSPKNNCSLEPGKYYEINDSKAYLFEKPTLKENPKEYLYSYGKSIIVYLDTIRETEHTDGKMIAWAKCKVYHNHTDHDKWILCDHLAKEVKNFHNHKSLKLSAQIDTLENKLRFKLSLINESELDIEIPEAVLKRNTKGPGFGSGGSVMDMKRKYIPAGKTYTLINDEVIMGGYNKSNLWYAPKSYPNIRILPVLTDYSGKRRKGPVEVVYYISLNNSDAFKIASEPLKINLPISESFVKEKYR